MRTSTFLHHVFGSRKHTRENTSLLHSTIGIQPGCVLCMTWTMFQGCLRARFMGCAHCSEIVFNALHVRWENILSFHIAWKWNTERVTYDRCKRCRWPWVSVSDRLCLAVNCFFGMVNYAEGCEKQWDIDYCYFRQHAFHLFFQKTSSTRGLQRMFSMAGIRSRTDNSRERPKALE
jgi:hypothetical protein